MDKETIVAECAYSGEPVYPWDSVVIFENGAVVLEDYFWEYAISRGIIKRYEGWQLDGI